VVQLIHQSSANTAHVRHPRAAKTDTNYAEGKVRSGDPVESDASKYSPNSEVMMRRIRNRRQLRLNPRLRSNLLMTLSMVMRNLCFDSLHSVL
jgi:hypothetical protein